MAAEVFIAHDGKDLTRARRLVQVLEAAGLTCWLAARDVVPGSDWPVAIDAAIHGCRVLVLLLTADALGSVHVAREVTLAAELGRSIVPVRYGPLVLTGRLAYWLAGIEHVDLFPSPRARHVARLIQSLTGTTVDKAGTS